MASTHGNLVLPPSRPVAEGGTEDHRSRRAIAPPIASRLSESAFASGPPKVSSPRCSPDAYDLTGIEEQAEFLVLCLDAWLEASGRKEQVEGSGSLDPENVAYQGRVLVSFLTLVPACLWLLKKSDIVLISNKSKDYLIAWLKQLLGRAGLLERKRFIPKSSFKKLGYLGSGGIGRFRDTLWAASLTKKNITRLSVERKHKIAEENRSRVRRELASNE